jgi:hypothetical protein
MIMAYTPYYAPYSRPMGYYNPSIPQQDMNNMQNGQQMAVQQPIQQMPIQAPTQFVQSQPTNDMLFVLNENEASAYPVAPNNSVVLWDKNNKTFYIKTANAQGIPSMQIYDFTERTEKPQNQPTEHKCTCGDKFATKEQINDLKGKIDDLTAKYEELLHPVAEKPKTTSRKTKESEE